MLHVLWLLSNDSDFAISPCSQEVAPAIFKNNPSETFGPATELKTFLLVKTSAKEFLLGYTLSSRLPCRMCFQRPYIGVSLSSHPSWHNPLSFSKLWWVLNSIFAFIASCRESKSLTPQQAALTQWLHLCPSSGPCISGHHLSLKTAQGVIIAFCSWTHTGKT